jgi:transposase-like protein
LGRQSQYREEFRREAVRPVLTTDKSMAEVARDLGVNNKTLGNWVRSDEYRQERDVAPGAISESERHELTRLRKENAELKSERSCARRPRILPRRRCGEPLSLRLRVRPDYEIKRLCRVLKVSRSGYYTWTRRAPSAHGMRDAELAELIGDIYRRSRRTYGAPRVLAELRRIDQHCGRKRVARLMAAEGLVGAHARRRWRTGKPPLLLSTS